VAYVQNWAYLFSSLPPGATWAQLPVSFLAVSHPVARFVEQATGRSAPILRPHVDPAVFRAPGAKARDVVNVAYMPRKNKALVDQIRALCASRARPGCPAVNWIPVQGTDHHGVAELLRAAHIFLATGFPEGCPLPPLEAMACGCLVVGFPGLGGWDYMRQVPRESGSRGAAPWFPLRDVSWSGNGFWAADGDVLDAALALEEAVRWWTEQPPRLAETLANGQAAAAQYTPEHQRAALDDLWQRAADGELFPPARR
jgi:glycosyltransferase involved in cell wall biosynthesis